MFVVRGENFKKGNYFDKAVKAHSEYFTRNSAVYSKKIEEEKNKKIEFEKSHQYLEKPISKLTEQEKKQLISEYCDILRNFVEEISKDDINLEIAQKEVRELMYDFNDYDTKIDIYTDRIKRFKSSINIALDSQSITRENIASMKKAILEFKKLGINAQVIIDGSMSQRDNKSLVNYVYSKEELNLLSEFDAFLLDNDLNELRFSEKSRITEIINKIDEETLWTLSQVVEANNKIDEIAKYIKENHFSPFEAMIYIHKFATGFKYKEYVGDYEIGRVLPSILTSDKIVCSGYASLVKAIVDKLDMPSLKCDLVGCTITSNYTKKSSGHCHNLVYIRDEKYGVNGYYAEDASLDSLSDEYEKGKGFTFCLYPIRDVEKLIDYKYYNEKAKDRLSNLLITKEYAEKHIKPNYIKHKLDEIFRKTAKAFNIQLTPYLIKKYGNNSAPIGLEKYRAAIEKVHLSIDNDLDEAREYSKKEIENSRHSANAYFKIGAGNSFLENNDNKKR